MAWWGGGKVAAPTDGHGGGRPGHSWLVDFALLAGLAGLGWGLLSVAGEWNGKLGNTMTLPVTSVTPTRIVVAVPAKQFAAAGTYQVNVTNPVGGKSDGQAVLTILAPGSAAPVNTPEMTTSSAVPATAAAEVPATAAVAVSATDAASASAAATAPTFDGLEQDTVVAGVATSLTLDGSHFAPDAVVNLQPTVKINLSAWALPWYTTLSLFRGMAAYIISLLFSLAYGYWAAKDPNAGRVLIPVLDILQSIPVLGFMPGLVLALVALFPSTNVGLELAAVLMIFTGQAWNMTFSFYRSLQTVPREQREAAAIFGFDRLRLFRQVELPAATLGLVWNSMMSMAGGWFFLSVSEAFTLGQRDFRLAGLGSYMSEAMRQNNYPAQVYGIIAMVLMIVLLDQLLWRPLVAWAQKFRTEEGASSEVPTSWFLDLLRRSRLTALPDVLHGQLRKVSKAKIAVPQVVAKGTAPPPPIGQVVAPGAKSFWSWSLLPLGLLLAGMAWGMVELTLQLLHVKAGDWGMIWVDAGLTLARVVIATALATLWTVPAGLAIGLSPKLSRIFQPIIQVVASFPAPMLFGIAMTVMTVIGDHLYVHDHNTVLCIGSVALMMLGTQWYILFNVIAGSMAIPNDLREAATAYHFTPMQRFRLVYLPAIFPALVTGWVTAMGGAWNASIVAEVVTWNHGEVDTTAGLGSLIAQAATDNNIPLLIASVMVMAAVVVGINRLVWRRLYDLAETRFSLEK
jgi:NitT/TauT family transport system permease protein